MKMNMKKIIIICAVIVSFLGLAQDSVRGYDPNLPADFPELIITKTEDAAPGVWIGNIGKKGGYRVILDKTGYPLFYSKDQKFVHKLVLSNGLISVQVKGQGFLLKDESFTVVDKFAGSNGRCFVMLPNGNAIVGAGHNRQIDMSQVVPGGRPDAVLRGGRFLEMDANKHVLFEWNCLDYMPLTETLVDLTKKNIDFTHLNYVNIDPVDHNYLLSIRHSCSVLKVSRTTGEIIWRLGGPANDFTFIGEHEENAPYYFVGQHSVHRLANGNILFFDNGGTKGQANVPERTYSRAVEYHLDEVNMTATLVWEYRNDPDIYAGSNGDVQRFDNGNTLIVWGAAVRSGAPIVTEVTPAGEVAFEMSFANLDEAMAPCNILKHRWNSPDLVHSQTYSNIEAGQTYDSASTGVSVTVNSLAASPDYYGLVVKKHDVAVRFPRFSGKPPWVLQKRVTLAGFGITSLNLDATFGTQDFDINETNQLTVYHRPYVGQGEFAALATTFDDINETLNVANVSFGEFVFGYPDAPEIPLQPILHAPEDLAMVNQAQPVVLQWIPRGFGRSCHLQIATDAFFNNLIVDESGLKQYVYELASVDPGTTYYWRVNTTNYGGTSAWATRSFTAVPPMVEVTSPNGGEQWQRGLDYFILWDDNLAEDVVIELYKSDMLVKVIGTTASIGAYEWEVDLDLEPGCDYSIKVKSSEDEAIFDMSDEAFGIDPPDTTPPEFELSVAPAIMWPPTHKMVLITPSLTVSDDIDPTPDVSLVGIVANEGDDTIGDGHTTGDIQIGDDSSIYL
ncbi:MAG: aryl-sulfate sulfotransferase, partial [Planctomycetota bacterium]